MLLMAVTLLNNSPLLCIKKQISEYDDQVFSLTAPITVFSIADGGIENGLLRNSANRYFMLRATPPPHARRGYFPRLNGVANQRLAIN